MKALTVAVLSTVGLAGLAYCLVAFLVTVSGGVEQSEIAAGRQSTAGYFIEFVLQSGLGSLGLVFWVSLLCVCGAIGLKVFVR
ncbi:MAG: hypothetical protein AAGH41_01175 [Pseudomonadota bacterium]